MDPRTRATIGQATPKAVAIAEAVLEHLERVGRPLPPHPDTGYPVIWGKGTSSEHATGRALDFMVTGDVGVGEVIASYLWKHRHELGLVHVIWRQRILSTVVQPGVWRPMADRGSPTENHMDHPHAYFTPAPLPASFQASAAPAAPAKSTKKGLNVTLIDLRKADRTLVRGAGVKPLQRLLRVTADGMAGRDTRAALGAAQRRAGLPVDYIFGPDTAEALLSGRA